MPSTTPPDQIPDERFLSGPEVGRRYGVNARMTLWRWLNDPSYADLGFPQPAFRIRDRRYWREADLVAWERERAAHPLPKRAKPRNSRQQTKRVSLGGGR